MIDFDFCDWERREEKAEKAGRQEDAGESPELCERCGGLRNSHLDHDASQTCKKCLDQIEAAGNLKAYQNGEKV